jgi:RNA polymerase sigma-70 factor (ECF subfamily)
VSDNAASSELCNALEISDEEIVRRVLAGEIDIYEKLMRRHNQRLFRMARSVIPNDTEAEDIVQEAFVRAYVSLSKFEGRSTFATWVTRIAYHEALRIRRKQTRDKQHKANLQNQSSNSFDRLNDQSGEGMHRKEVVKMVCKSFDKLTTIHRSVLMLRLVEGLSTRETAQCMRISESNVKVLLHRAKSQFAGKLEEHAVTGLCERFSFAEERCDRIVRETMARISNHVIA